MAELSKVLVKESPPIFGEMSDAHCHLELFKDPGEAVRKANFQGVGIIITAGGTVEGNAGAVEMTRYGGVFATIGIDPSGMAGSGHVERIKESIKANRKIIGIGESGLDSKYLDKYAFEDQKRVFVGQIEIAKELDVPVVVHSRGMMDRTIQIIKDYPDVRFMMHFFEGTVEQAAGLAEAGCLISIPTVMSSSRKKVINHLGIDNIVVETDSPVVGENPSDVKKSIELISKMKGFSFYDVAAMMTENLKRFFYI